MVKRNSNFICDICNKICTETAKLRRHKLIHTKEKPFKCNFCEKSFSLNYNLKVHIRIHRGEKPYVCRFENCNRKFVQSSNLKVHQKSHQNFSQIHNNPKPKKSPAISRYSEEIPLQIPEKFIEFQEITNRSAVFESKNLETSCHNSLLYAEDPFSDKENNEYMYPNILDFNI